MKHGVYKQLRLRWQALPSVRRATILVAVWALALVAMWRVGWQPAEQRRQQAERALAHEHALAGRLRQAVRGTERQAAPLTPAHLSASAQANGVNISGLESRGGHVELSVEGPPERVLGWLQQLQRDGASMPNLQLEPQQARLTARFSVELAD